MDGCGMIVYVIVLIAISLIINFAIANIGE